MTKLRIGLALGFASGYYLGAKAGRERYDQLNRLLRQVRRADALGKARAVIDLGRERARTRNSDAPVGVATIDLRDAPAYSSN